MHTSIIFTCVYLYIWIQILIHVHFFPSDFQQARLSWSRSRSKEPPTAGLYLSSFCLQALSLFPPGMLSGRR